VTAGTEHQRAATGGNRELLPINCNHYIARRERCASGFRDAGIFPTVGFLAPVGLFLRAQGFAVIEIEEVQIRKVV
jgi:hypothetical protein